MITAIPMKEDRVASHFTKADSFVFVNENGDVLSRKANPALNANCSGKKDLLAMLLAENAKRVIVRNIGERILGKLLESQFAVFQTSCGCVFRFVRPPVPVSSGQAFRCDPASMI